MGDEGHPPPGPVKRPSQIRVAWPRKPWLTKPRSDAPRWLIGTVGFRIALLGLDAAYQRQQLTLGRVRRVAASMATSLKRLELEIAQLDSQSRPGAEAGSDDRLGSRDSATLLADLRQQYTDLHASEERITGANRRLQAELANFRAAREAVETAYTAAEAAAGAAWEETTGSDAAAGT